MSERRHEDGEEWTDEQGRRYRSYLTSCSPDFLVALMEEYSYQEPGEYEYRFKNIFNKIVVSKEKPMLDEVSIIEVSLQTCKGRSFIEGTFLKYKSYREAVEIKVDKKFAETGVWEADVCDDDNST